MRGPPDSTQHPAPYGGKRRLVVARTAKRPVPASQVQAAAARSRAYPGAPLPKEEGEPIRFVVEVRTTRKCEEPSCALEREHEVTDFSYALAGLADGQAVTLQHGDVYWEGPADGKHGCPWDNCEGRHLVCIVKGVTEGHDYLYHWNVDGRASNCSKPQDKTHRCWVRHGDPAVEGSLHVDKAGETCAAGSGSIQMPGFHGFLHHGRLIKLAR